MRKGRMTTRASFLKRNWLKVLSVALVIAVLILSVLLFDTSRSYYYERNMHRYAMGEEYLVLQDSLYYLASKVNYNKSALSQAILEVDIEEATNRLMYMDPPHYQVWSNISLAYRGLRTLAFLNYFPDGRPDFPPDQVYQDILLLNASIVKANIEIAHTLGQWLFDPEGNILRLDEAELLNAGHISEELVQLVFDHIGPFA
jgi:hypothetical protein